MWGNIYLCFIEYVKVLDRVEHKELFELIGKLDRYNMRIIQNWEKTSCRWIGNRLCNKAYLFKKLVSQSSMDIPIIMTLC